MSKSPVLFIVGATGTGKSRLAMELAEELNLPIVNGDSVQVYQRVNIGTAKPSLEDRQKVAHHLFDEVAPPQVFTAGDYRARALEILNELNPLGPAIVVGGSGFYIQALQKGMYQVQEVKEGVVEQLQEELESGGLATLYEELKVKDPEFSAKISGNDSYRILRALSLIRSHHKTVSQIKEEFHAESLPGFPYPFKNLLLKMDRDHLRTKVRARAEQMIAQGLVAEVKELLAEDLGAWNPMQCVGYKETQAFLRGELDDSQLIDEITKNTMRLAKSQGTWFRREQGIQSYDVESEWELAKKFGREVLQMRSS